MTQRTVSIAGGVVCGLALLGLNYGPGGFNPWSETCAALMVAGFVVALVFHLRASRESHGDMAAEAGLRHVADYTGDIAFAGEPQGLPMRWEFQPPTGKCPFTTCRVSMELGFPSDLEADVSGKNVLTRDIAGLVQALPRLEHAPAWLEGFGVYGRPEATAREALARIGGLPELEQAGWTASRLDISGGSLAITATSRDFILDGDGLRAIQEACVRIALRTTGRA